MGPTFFWTLVAGSLSDKYGRKPLLILPMFGRMISHLVLLLNYIFFYELPYQTFYFGEVRPSPYSPNLCVFYA